MTSLCYGAYKTMSSGQDVRECPWLRYGDDEPDVPEVREYGKGRSRFWIRHDPDWARAPKLTEGKSGGDVLFPPHFFAGGYRKSKFPAQLEFAMVERQLTI